MKTTTIKSTIRKHIVRTVKLKMNNNLMWLHLKRIIGLIGNQEIQ